MSKATMLKMLRIVSLITILIVFTGCTHRISVEQYPMEEGMVASFLGEQPVNVISAQDFAKEELLGKLGVHTYLGNLQEWTDTAVKVLEAELNDRNIVTTIEAEKKIKLAITKAEVFAHFSTLQCKLDLKVATGDGDTMVFTGDKHSPWTLSRACGGAVVRAVGAMLNDPNILYYLKN